MKSGTVSEVLPKVTPAVPVMKSNKSIRIKGKTMTSQHQVFAVSGTFRQMEGKELKVEKKKSD